VRGLGQMTKMLTITLAMLVVRLFATGDVTSEAMSCISQCPLNNQSMSPSYPCVIANCFKRVGKCALDWTCRNTLSCMSKCTGQLAGAEGSEKFIEVQECVKEHCPGYPASIGCIAQHCKMVAAKCAFTSTCRHALECANECTPSIADVGLAKPEEDEELLMAMATDDPSTTEKTMSCISQCPLDPDTMAPSYSCVIRKCFMKVGKCVFNSKCRNTLQCMGECPKKLAKTKSAHRFIELATCSTDRCPGFPPSKLCVAAHCMSEAANCGIREACRDTMKCADKCSPTSFETDLAIAV